MSHEQDLTVMTEAAWTAFRVRLADHVAAMVDDDVLVVDYADAVAADDGDARASPHVRLCAYDGEWVHLEASVALDGEQEGQLVALGWQEPVDEAGWTIFHDDAERREADRVAVLLVRTLREVYAVPHPVFLVADGLEVDSDHVLPSDPEPGAEGAYDAVAFPIGSDDLQVMVDDAMRVVFPDLKHDDDGDIPIIAGRSLAYVRVLAYRPAVEVFAEIVLDPDDLGRLPLELGLLNRDLPLWKVVLADDRVMMRYEMVAAPFSAHLLRQVVHRFVDEVDAIAGDLVARVGGRRVRDLLDGPATGDDPGGGEGEIDEADLAMTGLLELCHLGRPRAATVAGLFDHDRAEIIRQIVRIRTGRQHCDGHDVDDVLTALRKALRLVSDGEPRPVPLPPKPRTVQATLLDDEEVGEDSLDLGWPA
ncbi:hypothetical protein [Nocardioides sp.]|uniref:T3SS (YopN, CesT) and YbjN peptide-binding chaperone 1 n=1 Tax=Nocardioides sp. TaxID=35761 RepID=UPI00272022E2|nr:hypothetical protein [Nocardioides sp.]MDO9456593.1 hypothetical protein [Nocardioides sp.]